MKLKNILLKIVNKTDKIFNLSLKESIAKKYLNHLLKDIGKIINLTIDTKDKMISMEILLKGETENLELVIGKYGISKHNDFIMLRNIKTNKEWLKNLMDKFIADKKLSVPKKFRSYLDIFK
jgi:hypothetical protein